MASAEAASLSNGAATFYTAPGLGSGLRGIELDRCYVGEYSAGRRHGFGTYTYPNSFFKYEGQWMNGEKHGLGKFSMRDGAYYEGEFCHGEMTGQGTRRFANGDVYIGTFEQGEMHGFGVMTMANGDTYQGPFEQNAFEGVGVYTEACGDVYEGDFVRHKRAGQGTLARTDGSRYDGGWVDNQRCGQGESWHPDGSWYKGSWQRGVYHGPGEWFEARSGLTYRGEFADGRPALLPTALTLTWVAEEEPRRGAKAVKGAEVEAAQPLPVVLGEPCPLPITLAAQLQERLPPQPPEPPPEPKAKGAARPPATPPGPVRVTVVNDPPEPGCAWRTADNEWGRQVYLTLHREPPRPLPPGRALSAALLPALLPDGSTRLRLLLSASHALEPALPLRRLPGPQGHGLQGQQGPGQQQGSAAGTGTGPPGRQSLGGQHGQGAAAGAPGAGGEVVTAVQLELAGGQAVLEGFVLGSTVQEDWERLASPTGLGYLVASSPLACALAPGLCRVALPDPKAKRPGAK